VRLSDVEHVALGVVERPIAVPSATRVVPVGDVARPGDPASGQFGDRRVEIIDFKRKGIEAWSILGILWRSARLVFALTGKNVDGQVSGVD
jgi:hypothetical protein